MREGVPRRTIRWLTDSIDRILSRDRMEWARKLQRKSLLSGSIDADVATPGKGKKGKSKGKSRGKEQFKNSTMGNTKDKPYSSRESPGGPKPNGLCYSFIKTGECTKQNSLYVHYSSSQLEQIKKALGHGNCGGREHSKDSNGSNGSRSGCGKGKGKGKGKRDNNNKSVWCEN